ncbi:phage integrase SAM-like domain-containing protein, partial [bacterium]|nr:phage integrase SAM-like domain-containing protein [bacterium]
GRRIRKAVGKDKKTAELALKDIEVRIAKEEHLGIHENKRVLFEDFAKEYLEYSKANKAPGSFRRDITNVRNLLVDFKGKLLSGITTEQIEKYKVKRRKLVSPASVNRELSCLSHMFTLAIRWGIVSKNPMKGVKKFKDFIQDAVKNLGRKYNEIGTNLAQAKKKENVHSHKSLIGGLV